jgi:hypothetical protein
LNLAMIIGLDSHNARKRKKSRKSKSRKARRYETRPAYLIRAKFNEKMGAEVLKPGATLADVGTLRTHMDAIMEGGTTAAREIVDRIEGKVPHRLEISGPERKEITIQVVYDAPRKLLDRTASE